MMFSRYRFAILVSSTLIAALLLVLASGCELSFSQGLAKADIEDEDIGLEAHEAVPVEPVMTAPQIISLALYLPTDNDRLLHGQNSGFFQDLPTTVPGIRPYRWMGGQYGIVRNPVRTPSGQTFTRLHQGIDIRPVYRDRNGEPLDTVRAIDGGTVAYVNRAANGSNYGRYVVIRHEWAGSGIYSLSAHLSDIWVRAGEEIAPNAPIGKMGYTGRGINQASAHLHLEVALMLNSNYQRWHDVFYRSGNPHGLHIGLNKRGLDVTGLYLALQEKPSLTISEFVRSSPVAYSIALPGDSSLDILERYPWLGADGITTEDRSSYGAWVISFTREGVPVEISRQGESVTEPTVVFVAPEIRRQHLSTAGILTRSGNSYTLTRAGNGYMSLLATTATNVPRWF